MPTPTTPPFTLRPGASATVTVRFTPSVAGTRNGSLSIVSNDAANSPRSVPLTGIGSSGGPAPAPAVTLSGFTGTLTFPATAVG